MALIETQLLKDLTAAERNELVNTRIRDAIGAGADVGKLDRVMRLGMAQIRRRQIERDRAAAHAAAQQNEELAATQARVANATINAQVAELEVELAGLDVE